MKLTKADDQSFAQMEMEEQDKADNLEPIEISEIEGAGALENEEELTDNESDGTDDVRKNPLELQVLNQSTFQGSEEMVSMAIEQAVASSHGSNSSATSLNNGEISDLDEDELSDILNEEYDYYNF